MENLKDREIIELKKRLIQYNDVLTITKNMNTELQKKNETLEIQNRQLDEDFCTLKDNNENLKKRFEILQKEILDMRNKNSKKSSMFDWIINGGVKEENEVLKEKLIAVENELNIKISENEQIHMEIFEVKQNFNEKIKILESEIDKMKMSINDKISELNSVNEKNSHLQNNTRLLEKNLNNITENLKKVENDFKNKTAKWKNKKSGLMDVIELKKTFEENLMPLNEYKNFSLNLYNEEFYTNYELIKSKDSEKKFKQFMSNIFENIFTIVTPTLDLFLELLIERFNFIYTNIELKTEHKGYLFACDKIRFHSFTLSQVIKTFGLFVKLLSNELKKFGEESNEENFMNLLLNININLTLLNKSVMYFELITKYYKILLKEERKILENFSSFDDNPTDPENEKLSVYNKNRLNKELKILITKLNSQFKIFVKKINLLTNFDLEFNLKNIQIVSDNTSCLFIKVDKNYFKNFRYNSSLSYCDKLKIIENIFGSSADNSEKTSHHNLKNVSNIFSEFIRTYLLKIENEYKMFEKIKDLNKHKFNYPIINLSALNTNNENMKKTLSNLHIQISEEIFNIIKKNLDLCVFSSWQYPDRKVFFSFIKYYQMFYKIKTSSGQAGKIYNLQESGVDYETAIKNRAVLKELLEKENSQLRDKENFMTKITEYEEDLSKFRQKLSHEQNEKDLLRLKLQEMEEKIKSGIANTSMSNTDISTKKDIESGLTSSHSEFEEFEEFIKNQSQCNITEIFQEILSDDVESGTQRSTFKLSKYDKCIPVTNFTAQIENNNDVSVLYHRKLVEKLKRYSGKIKNIDTKVLINLHLDEIKSEYDKKLDDSVKKYEKEIDYLNKLVKQKEDNIYGYTEQILVLNSFANDLENIRDNIKDCQKCKKFIHN